MLRIGNMDTHQRARENDTIDATQNALTHHTNEKKIQKDREKKDKTNEKDTNDLSGTGDESEDRQSSNTHKDQDSDVSFENDTEEEIDTAEIEEDWIEYIKRSTKRCHRKDGKCEDSMLEQDSQKMKWKLALRIATSPSERWFKKSAEWNPELSSKYRTNRAIGRPRKRWEDDINEFLKLVEDETENLTESSSQINKTWINTAKDRGRWALLEEKYTMTSEERQENNARTRMRRNNQGRPASYSSAQKSYIT